MSEELDPIQAGRVLTRLGLERAPGCSLDGLTRLYRGWCRNVPFDNVRKRIFLAAGGRGPLPGATPADFFEGFVADGSLEHPAWGVRVEPYGSLWQVWWKAWRGRPDALCRLEIDDVGAGFFAECLEASRSSSPFNTALYVRRNTEEGLRLFARGTLTEVDGKGIERATLVTRNCARLLVETFGFSSRIAARIPADEAE